MLRAAESVESIAAKLAIFNCVAARAYESEVRGRSPSALSRLLREPLHRVRQATERPVWVGQMDDLLDGSTIVWEEKSTAKHLARRRQYCIQCLESFYHSWIHDLSWMDHCFVHRGSKLNPVSPRTYQMFDADALVEKLYTSWAPALKNHIRSPEVSHPLFARLSNRKLRFAVRALGALFTPSSSSKDSPGAFACHPVALDHWWEGIPQRGLAETIPRKRVLEVARGDSGDAVAVAGAVRGDAPEAQPSHRDCDPEKNTPATTGYSRAEVGIVIDVRAHSRSALVCSLVSAIQRCTDNWLTQHYGQYRHLRFVGEARLEPHSAAPNFHAHLARVLATGAEGRERLLLQDFIARLSRGHERCLEALRKRYDSGDHLAIVHNSPFDSDFVAYHLREHGVCARLVTLDLVTRMLRPHFLCLAHGMQMVERLRKPDRNVWQHASLRMQGLFGSHEWSAYGWEDNQREVFPPSAQAEHFAHTLRAVEWAFHRREARGHGPEAIHIVLNEIAVDRRMVMVIAEGMPEDPRGGELIYTYFSPDGVDPPDWGLLAAEDPLHAERTLRVLDEVRTHDLRSRWWDLFA